MVRAHAMNIYGQDASGHEFAKEKHLRAIAKAISPRTRALSRETEGSAPDWLSLMRAQALKPHSGRRIQIIRCQRGGDQLIVREEGSRSGVGYGSQWVLILLALPRLHGTGELDSPALRDV
jgi:hypothetical protein